MSGDEIPADLTDELVAVRRELERHNRNIIWNRFALVGLGFVLVLVVILGSAFVIDDHNDDRRECRTDNANSIRDSEVLIGAAQSGNLSPEAKQVITRYREDVRKNLREC